MHVVDQAQRIEITSDDFKQALDFTKDQRAKRFDDVNSDKYIPGASGGVILPTLGEIKEVFFTGRRNLDKSFPAQSADVGGPGGAIHTGYNLVRAKRDYITHCPEGDVDFLYEDFSQITRTLGDLEALIRRMETMDFSSKQTQAEMNGVLQEIGKDLSFNLDTQLIPSFNARRMGERDFNGSVSDAVLVMEYAAGPVTLTLKQNCTQWIVEKTGDFNFAQARTAFLKKFLIWQSLGISGKRRWSTEDVNAIAEKPQDAVAGTRAGTRLRLEEIPAGFGEGDLPDDDDSGSGEKS